VRCVGGIAPDPIRVERLRERIDKAKPICAGPVPYPTRPDPNVTAARQIGSI